MKFFIYGISIRLYYVCVLIISSYHWKAKKWIAGRKNWQSRLKDKLEPERPTIWIYSPSIGEFQECRTFVHRIVAQKKEYQFVFTFHSPSGYDQAKIPGDSSIRIQLPIDTRKNASEFLDIVKPDMMFVLSSGIWLNYMTELKKRKIPHYIISFYGRENSTFFSPVLKHLYKPLFISFEKIFCYNQHCAHLLKEHFGFDNTVVIGNLRFDCVIEMKKHLRPIAGIPEFVNRQFCFVAGSTERGEDILLVKAIQQLKHLPIKWIIVPHEKLSKTLNWYQKKLGNDMCFYSKNFDAHKQVLVYDTTGDLFQLYEYATICLVGRGFHRLEIHNMLEPAVFNKAVFIGPKHKKFVEPKLFIQKKQAFEFKNAEELISLISKYYKKEIQIDEKVINEIFEENSGGTDIVFQTLNN
jgi:3-deoxy-D-manno-octulosonic-acid transferase